MKRLFDFICSLLGLIVFSPLLIPVCILVFLQDFKSPFYLAPRVSKGNGVFTMIKLRSMVVNADKSGVDSTSANDMRITKVGHFIRRFKLDELSQLYNVLIGDMSLVGPRPNVQRDTDLYSNYEKKLLTIRPGVTDFSSIVFSDEGDILEDHPDPDIGYNQLIRPWKSKLGIFYIENRNFILDVKLIFITIIAILSKSTALKLINNILKKLKADSELINVCLREHELTPAIPPGMKEVVTSRT